MKISYFFIVCFFVMFLSVKSNIFDELLTGAKKWWTAKPEERKQAVYKTAQEHVTNILNPKYAQDQLKSMYRKRLLNLMLITPMML